MQIDKALLDDLTERAKASPRLRMNLDLRNSAEDSSQRILNAIEPGTVLPIHRHRESSETVVMLRGKGCWGWDVVRIKNEGVRGYTVIGLGGLGSELLSWSLGIAGFRPR